MPPSTNSPRPTLSRRDLKAISLWTARMLASEDGQTLYAESIRVTIEKTDEAESIEVRPAKGVDGLNTPESLAVGRSDRAAGSPADPDEILRVMFSRDELNILSQLVAESKATVRRAKSVQEATKIPEGKFWVLWSNLQQRGNRGGVKTGSEWARRRESVRRGVGRSHFEFFKSSG
jgi:hypothetical protein